MTNVKMLSCLDGASATKLAVPISEKDEHPRRSEILAGWSFDRSGRTRTVPASAPGSDVCKIAQITSEFAPMCNLRLQADQELNSALQRKQNLFSLPLSIRHGCQRPK